MTQKGPNRLSKAVLHIYFPEEHFVSRHFCKARTSNIDHLVGILTLCGQPLTKWRKRLLKTTKNKGNKGNKGNIKIIDNKNAPEFGTSSESFGGWGN